MQGLKWGFKSGRGLGAKKCLGLALWNLALFYATVLINFLTYLRVHIGHSRQRHGLIGWAKLGRLVLDEFCRRAYSNAWAVRSMIAIQNSRSACRCKAFNSNNIRLWDGAPGTPSPTPPFNTFGQGPKTSFVFRRTSCYRLRTTCEGQSW